MVAKCANPHCSALFRYLKQGKLFVAEKFSAVSHSHGKARHKGLQHVWLCDACCEHFTIKWHGNEAQLTPLRSAEFRAKAHRAAS